jgi:hypothetical protein
MHLRAVEVTILNIFPAVPQRLVDRSENLQICIGCFWMVLHIICSKQCLAEFQVKFGCVLQLKRLCFSVYGARLHMLNVISNRKQFAGW